MANTNDSHKNLEKIDVLIAKGKKANLADIIKEKANSRLSSFVRQAIYEYMVEMDSDFESSSSYILKFAPSIDIVVSNPESNIPDLRIEDVQTAISKKREMENRFKRLSVYSKALLSMQEESDSKKRKYKYISDYHKEKYENIRVWVAKGDKEFIKEHADKLNVSYSEFAIHATLWFLKKEYGITVNDTIAESRKS